MELLPPGPAATRLGVSTRTLARWVADGYVQQGVHFWCGPHPNSPRRWDTNAVLELQQLPTNSGIVSDNGVAKMVGST